MIIIKILGIAILFFTATALGFFAAFKGECELKNLNFFIARITELRDRILYDGSEKELLLNKVFDGSELFEIKNGKVMVLDSVVCHDDKKILDEFFLLLGTTERHSEVNRAELCLTRLKESSKRLSVQTHEKARLYRILGVCGGILGCILFI